MAAFATVSDLQASLGLAAIDNAQAQLVLDGISDEIRATLGWSVTEETGQVLTLDGTGDTDLFVPTLWLTAVTSVVEDGVTLASGTDYLRYNNGTLRRVASGSPVNWTCKPLAVSVTYAHGYPAEQLPGVFKTVTLEYAGRVWHNPAGALKAKTVGRVSVTYADARAAAAGAGEDPRLARYRLPGAVA